MFHFFPTFHLFWLVWSESCYAFFMVQQSSLHRAYGGFPPTQTCLCAVLLTPNKHSPMWLTMGTGQTLIGWKVGQARQGTAACTTNVWGTKILKKWKNTAWEAQMLAVVVVVFFLMLELCSSLQLVDGPTTAQVRVACRQIVCGTAPWWQWTVTTCRNSL